jgi:hypothetical protein
MPVESAVRFFGGGGGTMTMTDAVPSTFPLSFAVSVENNSLFFCFY